MIKVMIADDQTILAEGIKSVLETSDQIEVIALGFRTARRPSEKSPKTNRTSCFWISACPT